MPAKKLKTNTSRSETVTVRLDPKIRYIAEIAAREQQRTLSSFIEWAVRRVLTEGKIDDEPEYDPKQKGERTQPIMWGEGYWDVDEADRFYLLAKMRPDLLTIPEQRLWKLFNLTLPEPEYKSLAMFRKFWESPMIDTNHLKEESE